MRVHRQSCSFRAVPRETLSAFAATLPSRRLGTAQEVANVIGFPLSEEASYVTGTILQVDGGRLNG